MTDNQAAAPVAAQRVRRQSQVHAVGIIALLIALRIATLRLLSGGPVPGFVITTIAVASALAAIWVG